MEISMFLFACYLRKGTWKFPCYFPIICVKVHGHFYVPLLVIWRVKVHGNFRVPFHIICVKLGTWKFSKYLLAYVCKGFRKEQFLHFHALIFRLSAENITIRIVFGKNYALCTKFYQIKQKPNHVWKEL